jgi:tRNA (cmo5U34)-methyltransferase
MSQHTQTAPEEMASFFDIRADGYEDHMITEVYQGKQDEFYARVVSSIPETDQTIRVLDLGCGTGFEVGHIFDKAPQARITCMDMSANMLELLQQKYAQYTRQIECVQGSYVTEPFALNTYNYAISVMTIHHLLEDPKRELYRKIRNALKDGGLYIEGDYVENEAEEQRLLKEYHDKMKDANPSQLYHIDIPFTVQRQERLFTEAGFKEVNTVYHEGSRAIFVVKK